MTCPPERPPTVLIEGEMWALCFVDIITLIVK
jgi:hypothetical protein